MEGQFFRIGRRAWSLQSGRPPCGGPAAPSPARAEHRFAPQSPSRRWPRPYPQRHPKRNPELHSGRRAATRLHEPARKTTQKLAPEPGPAAQSPNPEVARFRRDRRPEAFEVRGAGLEVARFRRAQNIDSRPSPHRAGGRVHIRSATQKRTPSCTRAVAQRRTLNAADHKRTQKPAPDPSPEAQNPNPEVARSRRDRRPEAFEAQSSNPELARFRRAQSVDLAAVAFAPAAASPPAAPPKKEPRVALGPVAQRRALRIAVNEAPAFGRGKPATYHPELRLHRRFNEAPAFARGKPTSGRSPLRASARLQ